MNFKVFVILYFSICFNSTITPASSKSFPTLEVRSKKESKSKGEKFTNKTRRKLLTRYPCKTRSGMTCSSDTAWHKRGFDSLTCK